MQKKYKHGCRATVYMDEALWKRLQMYAAMKKSSPSVIVNSLVQTLMDRLDD